MFQKIVSLILSVIMLMTGISFGDIVNTSFDTADGVMSETENVESEKEFEVSTSAISVSAGDSFTYTQADHWGKANEIWSWQWALADSNSFSDMTFTNVSGQGDCYVADWNVYPYCAARSGGINIHPHKNADAARVFTAPAAGNITLTITVARQSNFTTCTSATPTSFRVLQGDTLVYPSEGNYKVMYSTTPQNITLNLKVRAGEKIRFIVGAMSNNQSDSLQLTKTTVKYNSVGDPGTKRVGQTFTHQATSSAWGTTIPNWSWEYTPKDQASFSPMTYAISAGGYSK